MARTVLGGSLDHIIANSGASIHGSGEVRKFAVGVSANTLEVDIEYHVACAIVHGSFEDM